MLPGSIENLLRLAGILISVVLAIQPWFIATRSEDPFLFSSWAVFASGTIAICLMSVLFLFFRPRRGQLVFLSSFLLFFATITAATLNSTFNSSLRGSILLISAMLLAAFLRLAARKQDIPALAATVALSGGAMAIYSLLQYSGYDLLAWNSDYLMVGTFSNPNYLGAFLVISAIITFGLIDTQSLRTRDQAAFTVLLVFQLLAIFAGARAGVLLSLCFASFLYFTRFWEVRPGKLLRRSPLLAGLLLTVVITVSYGLIYLATASYPWGSLNKMPQRYMPAISRLVLWQMGFAIFLDHPLTGLGPGSIAYLMPSYRPPQGSTIGIKPFNDDPHSAAVSLLAELGFFSLWAVCSTFATLFGCYAWRIFKDRGTKSSKHASDSVLIALPAETGESRSEVAEQDACALPDFPWGSTLIGLLIIVLAYKAGFTGAPTFFYLIPLLIAFFGIYSACLPGPENYEGSDGLNKATMVALVTFVFYSLFNNSISIIPLSAFMVLIFSLHLSCCQRDLVWKRQFRPASVVFIVFPVAYVFCAYNFQTAHHLEQINLWQGQLLLNTNPAEAQRAFETAIKSNSQSLKAYYGLAISLEKQNRPEETQEVLKRLDTIVPNAFNTHYEMARIMLARKQVLEAHRHALKSLEWDKAPRSYEMLGAILLLEGATGEAEKVFNEGLTVFPGSGIEREAADRIRLNLASMAAERGDFARCRMLLEQITSEIKNDLNRLYMTGMLLAREKKYPEALAIFEKALETNPENPRLMNAAGFVLCEQNTSLERAEQLLENAYQLVKSRNPVDLADLLMVTHSLGKLYWKQNRMKEAGELLKIAWEQCPEDWPVIREERRLDYEDFCRAAGQELPR
ncbi:MAG TPA: tetratricopeptide repeat protein [Candidatus Rifleibacterium sp.]|nr:tetratricopeptide repeat protein [Candidatus Rifleibacterium sp.]HPT45627.1 tetratricopeptide repeat protein [Candidatus Rifleibacterium sp.]